jgi:hypothetical protein
MTLVHARFKHKSLQKLIKRTVYNEHQALLGQRQLDLLEELKKLADDGFEKAQEEYQRNVYLWGTCFNCGLTLRV